MLARADGDEIRALYAAETDVARRAGGFGSPTFIVDGEMFWGDDRLEEAIAWAVGAPPRPDLSDRSLSHVAEARLGSRPTEVSRASAPPCAVGDQAGVPAALQRGGDGADFRFAHADADGGAAGRALQLHAGDAVVGEALDQVAFAIEGPADDLADRAGALQRLQLHARDETVLQGRVRPEIADADIGHVGALREADDLAHRGLLEEEALLAAGRCDDGSGSG